MLPRHPLYVRITSSTTGAGAVRYLATGGRFVRRPPVLALLRPVIASPHASFRHGEGSIGRHAALIVRWSSPSPLPPSSEADAPKTSSIDVVKPSLWVRFKHEMIHYKNGSVLLAKEINISSKLLWRLLRGEHLSRREQRQLKRTSQDLFRLLPFSVFLIVPFMELLLPVALKLFPNMLPSTFEDAAAKEEKRRKLLKVRLDMAKFLRETIIEPKSIHASGSSEAVEAFSKFFQRVRTSDAPVETDQLLHVAKLFEDDLTLDNLSRPQLMSICRYMGLNAFGTDDFLRYLIRSRMQNIRSDDRLIHAEGVDALTIPELIHACSSRGIRTIGVSPARLRAEITQWLELSLEHKVPSTLLILSRAFSILAPPQPETFTADAKSIDAADALQVTLSSLPEELVAEVELAVGERSGAEVTAARKLEVIREQEELIEEEREQREREEKEYDDAQAEADRKQMEADAKEKEDLERMQLKERMEAEGSIAKHEDQEAAGKTETASSVTKDGGLIPPPASETSSTPSARV